MEFRRGSRPLNVVVAVLAMVAAACGSGTADTTTTQAGSETTQPQETSTTAPEETTTPAGATPQIGFAWTDPSIEVFIPLQAGALEESAARGYEVLFSNNGGDPAAQLADIQTWIGLGVAGLVILPLDPAATTNLADQAQAEGIVVVGYSDPIENQDGSTTFNHVQGGTELGQNAADWINENLGGNGVVGLLTIDTMEVGRQRIDSAVAVIEAETDSVIAARETAVSAADSLPVVQSMLQAHPDLNVILCVADDGCLGAAQAFEAAEIDPAGMYMAGWDGARPALEQIAAGDGYIKADAALDLLEVGRSIVYTVDHAINGGGDPNVLHDYLIVDTSTPDETQRLIDAYDS